MFQSTDQPHQQYMYTSNTLIIELTILDNIVTISSCVKSKNHYLIFFLRWITAFVCPFTCLSNQHFYFPLLKMEKLKINFFKPVNGHNFGGSTWFWSPLNLRGGLLKPEKGWRKLFLFSYFSIFEGGQTKIMIGQARTYLRMYYINFKESDNNNPTLQ